jgi:symplekin
MSGSRTDVRKQLTQLETARNLVLGDAALYPQIVQGVLPIIGVHARLELRRWGAEFLAETFASPALPSAQKELLAESVLPTIHELLDQPLQDIAVLTSLVQTAASLYTHVFRQVYVHVILIDLRDVS